jgi:hypothetical protein
MLSVVVAAFLGASSAYAQQPTAPDSKGKLATPANWTNSNPGLSKSQCSPGQKLKLRAQQIRSSTALDASHDCE